jgi:hypothetical protein
MRNSGWNLAGFAFSASLLALGCSQSNDGGQNGNGTHVGSGGSSAAPAAGMKTGSGGSSNVGTATGTGGSMMHAGTGGASGTGAGMNAGSAGAAPAAGGSGGHESAGSGGAAEKHVDAGMSGDGGMPKPVMHEDLGKGDGKDVVTIGDSWMNLYIAGIEQSLDKASGQMYRHYAVPGTLVLNEQIPGQYESAKMENPDIKTVVMTGGGNDILTDSCADTACNSIVDNVSARLTTLMQEMGKDGVLDLVLIGYTYPDDMTKRESLDYSRMLSSKLCAEDSMPRCHYLDSTTLMLTLRDGIHPDDAGYDLIGQTVWKMMQDDGMRR